MATGKRNPHRAIAIPPDLLKALEAQPEALRRFEAFAYTHRREYVEWVEDAKKQETRDRRVEKAVLLISQGKKFS
jgi:uncharacterized protein YdeI (YjbR/CyaY-like superfamily)